MVYFPFKELSYKIIGIFFQIKNSYGSVHKELIYQNAFEEELNYLNIPYRREVNISVSSVKTKKRLGFLGYLVNFGSTNIYFKRYILSNNNK